MADEGLTGEAWVRDRQRRLGSDYSDYGGSSRAHIDVTDTPAMRYSNIFSNGVRSNSGIVNKPNRPAYTGPKLGYNATKEDIAKISDWQKENIAPYTPPSREETFRTMKNPNPRFSREQNTAAVDRIREMEARNAFRGNLGFRAQAKEIGKELFYEVPVIGRLARAYNKGMGLTGNTKAGKAVRFLTDVGTTGMLGGPILSIAAGGIADAASDYFSPPKPLYKGGFTGRETMTRSTNRGGTSRQMGYWEK